MMMVMLSTLSRQRVAVVTVSQMTHIDDLISRSAPYRGVYKGIALSMPSTRNRRMLPSVVKLETGTWRPRRVY
jgi:hypothetical protein